MTKIIVSNSAVNLANALSNKKSATVEAEFGADLVRGSLYTLAHHGIYKDNPVPCSLPNSDFEQYRSELERSTTLQLAVTAGYKDVAGLAKEGFKEVMALAAGDKPKEEKGADVIHMQ